MSTLWKTLINKKKWTIETHKTWMDLRALCYMTKANVSYTMYDLIYTTLIKWQNYRNQGKGERKSIWFKKGYMRDSVVLELFCICTASMSTSSLWSCSIGLQVYRFTGGKGCIGSLHYFLKLHVTLHFPQNKILKIR